MKKSFLAVVFWLVSSVALAQIDTSVEEKLHVYGAKNPYVSSDLIVVDSDSKLEVKPATLLKVSKQGELSIRVEDKDRNVLKTEDILKEVSKVKSEVDAATVESTYLFLKQGKYWIYLEQKEQIDLNGRKVNLTTDTKQIVVEVKAVTPTPDPGPTPGPTPDVNPDNSWFNEPGFKVLIIVEDRDLTKLSREEQIILRSKEVRDALNATCVKGPDGTTPEWRVLDQNTVFPQNCSSLWCKGLQRPRSELPWIIINNNGIVYEGPLPDTVQELLALLNSKKG